VPLTQRAEQYADRLYRQSLTEILAKRAAETSSVVADFQKRNMIQSGPYISARADVLLQQIGLLAQARVDSLLRAYEKSGLAFDDEAHRDVKTTTINFCESQQHQAVGVIGPLIQQTFTSQVPPNFRETIVQKIRQGVDSIISRLTLGLDIKRDEIVLDEMRVHKAYAAGLGKKWDVFICHATEDKDGFVRPLAIALDASGLSVWYDEFSLKVGDSLRAKIDEGLANSRYGVVVLSNSFFDKNWPQHELDGLMSKEIAGTKVILPVWHNISFEEVRAKSAMLSGLVAAQSKEGLDTVVKKLREAMGL
jgi:TIR domain